jgi:dipeptidyl aminopeptidase/acylaminoacyl peptidase/CubicO group peptidase (beta-lactamase class C family)
MTAMRTFIARAMIAAGVAVAATTLTSSRESRSATIVKGDLATTVDQYLTKLTALGFSGAIIAARDGEVILQKGYGLSNQAARTPVTPDTVFDIGSVTKQFTGAAILKLEEQGKLKVTDRLDKYFPDVPSDKAGITLHHLLTHGAGFESMYGTGDYEAVNRDEFVRRAFAATLRSKPGETYEYSNAGYSLLGVIVEMVSGQGYEQYLNEHLFKTAGMSQTGYRLPRWDESRIAHGYIDGDDWGTPLDHAWAADGPYWLLRANGGILSTVGDMYKWHLALEGDRVLSKASKAKLYGRHLREGPKADSFYGYGWAIMPRPGNKTLIGHNGGSAAFGADFLRFVDDNVVIFMASNGDIRAYAASEPVAEILFGEPGPTLPGVADVDPGSLARYAGEYRLPTGGTVKAMPRANKVLLAPQGLDAFAVIMAGRSVVAPEVAAAAESMRRMIERAARGDYEPVKAARSDEVTAEEAEAWLRRQFDEGQQINGTYTAVQIDGAYPRPTRGTLVAARLQFERGESMIRGVWENGRLVAYGRGRAGVSRSVYPQGSGEFVSWEMGPPAPLVRARFDEDGKVLVIQAADGGIRATKQPAAPTRPMSYEDVIRLKRPFDAQISPDGAHVAFVVEELDPEQDRYVTHVSVVDVARGTTRRIAPPEGSGHSPRWSPNGRSLAFLWERDGRDQIYAVDPPDGQPRQLVKHEGSIRSFVWSPDGKEVAFLATEPAASPAGDTKTKPVVVVGDDVRLQRLWVAELAGGATRQLTSTSHVVQAGWSPDGSTLAFLAQPLPKFPEHVKRELYVVPRTGGEARRLTDNTQEESGIAWKPDSREIAYVAATEGNVLSIGPPRIHIVSASGGTPRVLAPSFDGYVGALRWAPDGQSLVFAAGLRVDRHLYRISSSGGNPEPLTDGEGVYGSFSIDRRGHTVAAIYENTTRPPDVWVASAPGRPMRPLTDLNPQAREWSLGKVQIVRWKSADGLEMEGLVALPVGFTTGRKYPTVMHVHGGPESAMMRGFAANWSHPAHIYAGAGFVYFMPNFRGSSNYGGKFALGAGGTSIAPEEGSFADCMTGLDHLIEKGIADPNRLGLKGWSYGGYFTAWAVGHTDRFKAAAEGAGDTNLVSYYGTAVINPGFDIRLEHPYDDPAKWHKRSPLTYASKVKTPTLILQGENDPIVPIGQSQEFYTALRHYNVPTQLIIYPDQPHGIEVPSYQVDKMRREFEWMRKYLDPRSPSSAAVR